MGEIVCFCHSEGYEIRLHNTLQKEHWEAGIVHFWLLRKLYLRKYALLEEPSNRDGILTLRIL